MFFSTSLIWIRPFHFCLNIIRNKQDYKLPILFNLNLEHYFFYIFTGLISDHVLSEDQQVLNLRYHQDPFKFFVIFII